MSTNENANLIEALKTIGFTDYQISAFLLAVTGHITLDEWVERYNRMQPD